MKNQQNGEFLSTLELARLLGMSRISVFNKIKKGEIKAIKVGRAYIINRKDVPEITGQVLNNKTSQEIDIAVQKTIREYGETLRLLGKE